MDGIVGNFGGGGSRGNKKLWKPALMIGHFVVVSSIILLDLMILNNLGTFFAWVVVRCVDLCMTSITD